MRNYNNNKLAIYNLLCRNAGISLTNQRIAYEVGIAPSTTFTALKALIEDELVLVDKATKEYRINALVADVYSSTIYEKYPSE